MDYSFAKEIESFIRYSNSIYEVFPALVTLLESVLGDSAKQVEKIIDKHALKREEQKDGEITLTFKADRIGEFTKSMRKFETYNIAYDLLPRTLVVSLVSQYDAFFGRIIRGIFYAKPEILKGSEKAITYKELAAFGSFDDAREHIIEEEVEALLRKNHSSQFDWVEKKLGIPLRKDLDIWPTFVELTERRNLFVHCDGIVSRQYLKVCKEHGVVFEKEPNVGEKIGVTPGYFKKAYQVIFDIGIKLGQVIWRKLLPDEVNEGDEELNKVCVDLITNEEYDLSEKLLSFAISEFSRRSTERMKLYYKFNLAQTYKWKGNTEECEKILSSIDVTTLSAQYRLADAVLRDDFKKAASIMRQSGKNGEVGTLHYREWPLFKEFRKMELFTRTYESVFGEPFKIETKTPGEEAYGILPKKSGRKKTRKIAHRKKAKKKKKTT